MQFVVPQPLQRDWSASRLPLRRLAASYAEWHPDGNRLVIVSEREGKHDLYLLNAFKRGGADTLVVTTTLISLIRNAHAPNRAAIVKFAAKVSSGHHFLSSVLKKPRIFLIGGEHELEHIIGRKTGGVGADKQTTSH